jgi:Na+/proline symporter
MRGLPLIDIAVMAVYFGLVIAIGVASSRRVATQRDFYVGGRRFGKFLTIMTSFGVGTSNTHPILVAGAVYTYGMPGIWYSWLYMLFMPAQWILEPLIRRLRIYTTADFFDLRYSKGLGPMFSISALLNVGIMISTILIAMGQIVEGITGGALSKEVVIPVAAVFLILYGTAGGMLAAAWTDVIQGVLILVMSFMLLPPLFSEVGGLEGLHRTLPAQAFSLAWPQGGDPAKSIGLFAIFVLFINGTVGALIEPQSQTKQAAKDEWTLRLGVQIGTFMKRICTVAWALVGLCALAIWPHLKDPEMSFGLAARRFLPAGFSGLMIAAMMAAAMSTADAMMVSGSAIFSRNLYAKYIRASKTDAHYLSVARIVAVILACVGLAMAFRLGTVTRAVELWWKVTAFVGPTFLLGMFLRRGNGWGAWACMCTSAAVWLLTEYDVIVPAADPKWNTVWYQAALYLPAGVGAYLVVSFLTPPEDKARLDRFFARLNTPVGQEHVLIATGLEPHPEEILPGRQPAPEVLNPVGQAFSPLRSTVDDAH